MRMGTLCTGLLAVAVAGSVRAEQEPPTPASVPTDAGIAPFSAHYVAEWKNITVGTSDLKLERGAQPGQYVYKWTISARGIFRIVYSSDLTQQSWMSVVDGHVRPGKYRAEEGSSSLSLDFDWGAGRAHGLSEGKPVQIELKPGSQDLMSIQVEIMLDLKNSALPGVFYIVDKDQLKDFIYKQEGTARIRTGLGPLDTNIVSSRRPGNDRILRMWFAPSLGFIPVQAERSRGDRLEFAMRIKSLKP